MKRRVELERLRKEEAAHRQAMEEKRKKLEEIKARQKKTLKTVEAVQEGREEAVKRKANDGEKKAKKRRERELTPIAVEMQTTVTEGNKVAFKKLF